MHSILQKVGTEGGVPGEKNEASIQAVAQVHHRMGVAAEVGIEGSEKIKGTCE
jgi:hypothetical protein